MSTHLPVVLSGRTLGDRHRQMNALVEDAFRQNVDFPSIENAPETSPLDRLFKIDLASKYQNVNYILKNLKDEDMLYVSKALNCKWLLEPKYSDIINPIYLEQELFPEMLTTSVTKMKKCIHMHLHDPQRCLQFYEYYVAKNNDLALSFLWHCSSEIILREAKNFLVQLTPQQLKLSLEKCPEVAKLYFDSLNDNSGLIEKYLGNEAKYYNSLKTILKSDTNLFLDITEKYFNINSFQRFSSDATKFIMINFKNRFIRKSELYTAYLLDVNTLAKYLSSDEIKDIITKLAKAENISTWFSYKNVEPLFKQLQSDDRVQFKKHIFVDKDFGKKVKQWPYTTPSPPVLKLRADELLSLDNEHDPRYYETNSYSCKGFCRKLLKKRKCGKWSKIAKSSLDKLFDRFRFQNFKQTFHVLRKEIFAARSIEDRMHMLLVLVSKSGGREEFVQDLLKWLVDRHSNEVITLRAAVVRSLVKRASIWRVPETSWNMFLRFAKGLGLDGTDPEADCTEGFHAVILRDILSSTRIKLPIFEVYLRRAFSSLSEYPLTREEMETVKQRLPAMLLAAADEKIDNDTSAACEYIVKALNVLQAYLVPADAFASVISAVKSLALKDFATAEEALLRLYNSHIGRKQLTQENFNLIQTEASYLNALRHEPELITNKYIHQILEKDLRLDGLLRKLAIYFGEEEGLAKRFMEVLDEKMKEKPRVELARPLATLTGASFKQRLNYYNEKPRNSIEKRVARGLKANAHVVRPNFDLDQFKWREAGVMAVANKVIVCSTVAIPGIVENLLVWRRAARVALIVAIRGGLEASAFSAISQSRPIVALEIALSYFRSKGESFDPRVWDSVKPLIATIDLSSSKRLHTTLSQVDLMPNSIRAEYAVLLFEAFKRLSLNEAMPILCHIENVLPEVNDEFITTIIEEILSKQFRLEALEREKLDENDYIERVCLFVRIIAKHLLLCRPEEEQKKKMENVGKPFLEALQLLQSDTTKTRETIKYLDEFIDALRYTRVFMDTSYVSVLPVLRGVADWMNEAFPVNVWFAKHTRISFNIILFHVIREIAGKYPKTFSDPPKMTLDSLQMIGVLFGKRIAEDLNTIQWKTFSSIADLYGRALQSYLNDSLRSETYNLHKTQIFAMSIREGVLKWGSDSSSNYLAEMLHEEYYTDSDEQNDDYDIVDFLDDKETSFFRYYENSF